MFIYCAFNISYKGHSKCGVNKISQVSKRQQVDLTPGSLDGQSSTLTVELLQPTRTDRTNNMLFESACLMICSVSEK